MAHISVLCDLKHEIFTNDDKISDLQVIGQEENGLLLFVWVLEEDLKQVQLIGSYDRLNKNLKVLKKLEYSKNSTVIQATTNFSKSCLVYVVKTSTNDEENQVEGKSSKYEAYVSSLNQESECTRSLFVRENHQVMAQFLSRRKHNQQEKMLLFIHEESVTIYQLELQGGVDNKEEALQVTLSEQVLKIFTWAQWDAVNQCLYYIHYRKTPQAVEGEVQEEESQSTPILSALQFHDELPHETVLNIPLNLPKLTVNVSPCRIYEDEPVPLKVHDCSLDLTIVADHRGIVCICHHYLYQPLKFPQCERAAELSGTVHFAYSVTLLHHGRVVHSVVPGVLWTDAPALRPSFIMCGEQHMLVVSPGLFVHVFDIGPNHEPCCHIVLGNETQTDSLKVVPLQDGSGQLLNVSTLEVVEVELDSQQMVEAYLTPDMSVENRLAILHYVIVHLGDMDLITELLKPLSQRCMDLDVAKILQEVLVCGSYASAARSLPSDALPLLHLLPLTTWNPNSTVEVKISPQQVMTLSQECLWNPAVMLLSPQQRLIPYRGDMWTRLWDFLHSHAGLVRFCPTTVADKLMVSLVCYQPEALSRCSTPLSPGGMVSSVGVGSIGDLCSSRSCSKTILDPLPFFEVEPSAASKQEHIISVNLRELNMHLLKRSRGRESPMQMHAVATRYAGAQLDQSRLLCQLITKAAGIDTTTNRGFPLVDHLSNEDRRVLFALLERYCLAVEGLAFPLPQGFSSFLAYLGYRTLPFQTFLQYVKANVLQLQIDVMKAVMKDLEDSKEGVSRKLRLLQILPRSRGKRVLNQWQHPASLMIRARQHAQNILSGVEGAQARGYPQRNRSQVITRGLAAFPSEDRVSPLDTFLDLLTAKANLAELDFNLLIAATTASTEEFSF